MSVRVLGREIDEPESERDGKERTTHSNLDERLEVSKLRNVLDLYRTSEGISFVLDS